METNPIYEKNLSVIKEKHPGLFMLLDSNYEQEEKVEVRILKGSGGFPNAVITNNENARTVRLHDDIDPFSEAERLADSMEIHPGELRFLIGMGLGYLPLMIAKRKITLLKLFIVEKNLSLFEQAIRNVDLSHLFEADGVSIVIGELGDIKPLLYNMGSDISILLKGAEITYFEPERELFPDYFARCTKIIQDQVKHLLCGIHTTERIGPKFFENSMWNFTTTLKSANMGGFDLVWEGAPVMVVGAGPSLVDNIDTIKKYRDRFAIITVDSALPILIKNGVIPDLAATVDFHHISYEKYRDVAEATAEIPIVYAAQCATMTIKPYRCPAKFFIAQPYGVFSDLASGWKYWVKWQQIEAVSHLAVLSARVAGGSPVILVGFDLSYVGLKSYAEGTALTSNIDIEALVWVPDQKGNSVPTSVQMVGQKSLMEKHIAASDAVFVNISEGVSIEGAEPVDAEEYLSSLNKVGFNPREKIWAAWENAPKPSPQVVIAYLKKSMKELKASIRYCEKGMAAAEKAKKELSRGKDAELFKYRPLVEKALDYYDSIVRGHLLLQTAVGYYEGQDINLMMDESRLAISADEFSGVQKIEAEMAFVFRGIAARKNAGDKLLKIFESLHSRLSRELNLFEELARKSSTKVRSEIFAGIGEAYFNYMDYSDAESILRKAVAENEKNAKAWILLGKTLSALKRHLESLECFKKAVKVDPSSKEAKKEIEYEMSWPERMLDEANSYVRGDSASSSGQGQENWAVRLCKEIISIYPDNKRAIEIKERALQRIADNKERQEKLLPFLMAGCDMAVEMVFGIIDDNLDLAKRVVSLLRQQYPEHPGVIEAYGLVLLGEGDYKKAKNFLVQARSLAPEAYSPRVHLARVLAEEGNYEEALMYLTQAKQLAPKELAAAFLESIGDLQLEMKQYSEAVKNFEDYYVSFPERRDVLKKIGDCYAEMGLMDAAKAAWDASV